MGKDISSDYQKYRFIPPDEVKNILLQFLDEKVCHAVCTGNALPSFTIAHTNKLIAYLFKVNTLTSTSHPTSSEGAAPCAGSGSGMRDRSELPATGNTLPGSCGH